MCNGKGETSEKNNASRWEGGPGGEARRVSLGLVVTGGGVIGQGERRKRVRNLNGPNEPRALGMSCGIKMDKPDNPSVDRGKSRGGLT